MLKFLTKVWVAGEVNDFRRSYKKRKAVKKNNKRRINKEILVEISKQGKLETYSEYYSRGAIQMISGGIGILLAPFLPPLVIISPITFILGIKNLIKASVIYVKCSKSVNDKEIKRKVEASEFIKELQEFQAINNENKEK